MKWKKNYGVVYNSILFILHLLVYVVLLLSFFSMIFFEVKLFFLLSFTVYHIYVCVCCEYYSIKTFDRNWVMDVSHKPNQIGS